MMTFAPVIGITADTAGHPEDQGERAYMVRCNYVDAVFRAGGRAVILPYDPGRAADYVAMTDGLMVTGGRFDLPPEWYGAPPPGRGALMKADRSLAERALITAALAVDMPVLGLCNGMQLLGVMHGASIVQHIPDENPDALDHMAPETPWKGRHNVAFDPGSPLREIAGVAETYVNSVHHQAVRPAPGFRIAATAPDGVVEAIDVPGRRFCYGLQWHPEYDVSPADGAILKAFIKAAAAYRHDSPPIAAL